MLAVEQQKDDAKRLNKRYTMEMNAHMAHMFHVATEQAFLPAEQRTATPESICKNLAGGGWEIRDKALYRGNKV